MSRNYDISATAQDALDDIFDYTFEHYGLDQTQRYLGGFFNLFERIASGQEKGRLIQPQYRVVGRYARSGKHFVYWATLPDGSVAIAEILHERMNVGDKLADSAMPRED